jgi:hypothetical protein
VRRSCRVAAIPPLASPRSTHKSDASPRRAQERRLSLTHRSIQSSRRCPRANPIEPPSFVRRSARRSGASPRRAQERRLSPSHRPRACRDSVAPLVPDLEDPRSSPGRPRPQDFTSGGSICLNIGVGRPPRCSLRPKALRSGPAVALGRPRGDLTQLLLLQQAGTAAPGLPKSSWPTAPSWPSPTLAQI